MKNLEEGTENETANFKWADLIPGIGIIPHFKRNGDRIKNGKFTLSYVNQRSFYDFYQGTSILIPTLITTGNLIHQYLPRLLDYLFK